MSDAQVRRPVTAWIWGGGMLALSAIVPILIPPGGMGSAGMVVGWVRAALFAAAMVVFARGLRGHGSIVARRVPGVIALIVVGTVLPLVEAVSAWVFVVDPERPAASSEWIGTAQVVNMAGFAVWAGAALVAGVEVARARVVPGWWRWAPLGALGVIVLAFVGTQVAGVQLAASGDIDVVSALFAVWGVAAVLVPLALGVAALALGARGRPTVPTQVYPPVA